MKYIKLFEDYSKFNTNNDEWHRSVDFTKEEEHNLRKFAKDKGYNLGDIIGIGFGGVAFDMNDKVFKYTYDDIEVSASIDLEGKNCEYLANVYETYETEKGYVIILEKLGELPDSIVDDLKEISTKFDKHPEYNFDDLIESFDENFNDKLSDNQKKLYSDLLKIKEEGRKYNIDIIDCKIDNLGIKNGHIAMFDVKCSGY